MENLPPWLITAKEWILENGMPALTALVIIFVAWIASRVIKGWLTKAFLRGKFDPTLSKFFANMARYAILIAAGIAVLGKFGVETTSFAALIGAAGLAVGLAFQGTLANFSAGVMLLIFRPFNVDDLVEVGGTIGVVVEIELFTTELITAANIKIIIPNGAIFGSQIKNFTAHPHRRVDVDLGCDYSADIDETRKVLEKAIADIPGAAVEPAPQVFLASLGGSSVDWQLRCYCEAPEYWGVYQGMIRAAKYALDEAEIGIPFPQMDVHIDGSLKNEK